MKKILESELMTIAHNILKLKGKEDLEKMYLETQKLYEKLTILKFYEKNKSLIENDYPVENFEIDLISDKNEIISENIKTEKATEALFLPTFELSENNISEVEKEVKFEEEKEIEEEAKVEIEKEVEKEIEDVKKETNDIFNTKKEEATNVIPPKVLKHDKIEEYLFDNYEELEFVAKKSNNTETIENTNNINLDNEIIKEEKKFEIENKSDESDLKFETKKETKDDLDIIKKIVEEAQLKVDALKSERSLSLNDSILKGINIGLNDRIGFVKHLFNGSNEDYNRVISQLSTIETFKEAHEFINIHIKPDYNKWQGKEDYEIRFLNLIEKKYL